MPNLIDTERLQTVQHYAETYRGRKRVGVTVGYIYQLINEGKLSIVEIDGIKFVLLPANPSPPPPVAGAAGVAG